MSLLHVVQRMPKEPFDAQASESGYSGFVVKTNGIDLDDAFFLRCKNLTNRAALEDNLLAS